MQLEEDADAARPMLLDLRQRVRETIARSRDMVSNLHAMAGPEEDLVQMLRRVEGEFRVGREPQFVMAVQGETGPLHPMVRDEMYRACREAIANAFRHSGAAEVRVLIESSADRMVVTVCDDGKGMEQSTLEFGRPGHFGLAGMRVHAASLGGSIRIRSGPGEGTEVRLEFPRGHQRAHRLLGRLRALWRHGKSEE
jgi:signal transduction histidine kinase